MARMRSEAFCPSQASLNELFCRKLCIPPLLREGALSADSLHIKQILANPDPAILGSDQAMVLNYYHKHATDSCFCALEQQFHPQNRSRKEPWPPLAHTHLSPRQLSSRLP
jgi:hypothetical protein